MHVFQDLDYLGHHDNFLYYFLQNVRNFDDSILGDDDGVSLSLHYLGDSSQGLFDEVDLGLDYFLFLFYQLLLHLKVDGL